MAGYQPKVYRDEGGNRQVIASGGTFLAEAGASVDLSALTPAELALPAGGIVAADLGANLKTGYIPLPLTGFRLIAANDLAAKNAADGGLISLDTDPTLKRVNAATDKKLRIGWAANSVIEIQQDFSYPPDLDDTAPIVVNLLLAKDTNTDTTAVVAVGYFEGVGDANAGGNTAALAAAALAVKTVAIAHGDVGAAPTGASVTITPGAHANDAVFLYGAYVTYTRKT